MAITVTFRGVQYTIPEPADAFTQAMTDYLNAISTGAVPYPTTADLDLGASFGIKALDFKTRSANPAASGLLRLAAGDTGPAWRNAANSGDVGLTKDSGDNLLFNGANITGNPMLDATTAAGQSIPNAGAATIVVFGTVALDTDSGYNAGTGRYTIPAGKGGPYEIASYVQWNAASTGPFMQIFKNAAALKTLANAGTGTVIAATGSQGGATAVTLVPGDVIDIRIGHFSAGAVVLVAAATGNFVSLKRIPS